MIGPTVRLGTDEMWRMLDHIDLVEELRGWLRGPSTRAGELSPLDTRLLTFHDESTGRRGELTTEDLRGLCTAGLAALSARLLQREGAITAGVVGPHRTTQWLLDVIGRYVPNLSHIAVFSADRAEKAPVDLRVLDQLDLKGIGLTVATSVADAVLGATLVIALGQAGGQIGYDQLARGSLVINPGGRALSDNLRESVARCYTVGDLVRILGGDHHPGQIQLDEVLLVELLEPGWQRHLETRLAGRLVELALEHGVGVLDRNGAGS